MVRKLLDVVRKLFDAVRKLPELVRKLRESEYPGKIVVLSGYLSPENIGTYEELAVDEVVGKPFDSDELREVIASLEDEL